MAKRLIPTPPDRTPVAEEGGAMAFDWYRRERSVEDKLRELEAFVETLRAGLNQTRTNPTTVYPDIDPM